MCPRGAFLDLFLGPVSRKVTIPAFFKLESSAYFYAAADFYRAGCQFYLAWGNLSAMGLALVRVLTITTVVGILLGLGHSPSHLVPHLPNGHSSTLGRTEAKTAPDKQQLRGMRHLC